VKAFTVLLIVFSIGTLFTAQPSFMPSQQPSTTTVTTTATTTATVTSTTTVTTTLTTTSCYLAQTFSMSMTVHIDKSTYLQGETVNVTGDWEIAKPPYVCGYYDIIILPRPMVYVVTDLDRRNIYSTGTFDSSSQLPYHYGNFSFGFVARYDWSPGNYTLMVFSGILGGQASATFGVVLNPSATVTTVTTLTTYTTTVSECTSLVFILVIATLLVAVFVRSSRKDSRPKTRE